MFYPVLTWVMALAVLLVGCPVSFCAAAQTITFDQILAAGLKNGFDAHIAAEGVRVSEAAVTEAKADLYPQLSLRFGQEYVHVYDEFNSVVSIGDTVYSDSTSKYKHSLGFYSQYNLYDFGRRRLTIEHARQQVHHSELQLKQVQFEISIALLERYAQALKLQKQLAVEERAFAGRKRIFQLSQQLGTAGKMGQQEIGEAALLLAQTTSRMDALKVELQSALDAISVYTREEYHSESLLIADFTSSENLESVVFNVDQLPQVRILDQQIRQKETELAIAKRANLPQLTLNGSFGMYGSDDHSYHDSLDQMSKRDAGITLSLTMPIFDGFAAAAKKQRLQHEINRLQLKKRKAGAELQADIDNSLRSYHSLTQLSGNRNKQQRQVELQINNYERLSRQQLTDQVTLTRKTIDLAQYRLETRLQAIDTAASAIRLSLLQGAGL